MPKQYITPDLPYPYDALEPHIDAQTMTIHHDKHHAGYTAKLNAAVAKHPELFDTKPEELLAKLTDVPDDIRTAVRNNGGGHVNHALFWESMSPEGGGKPTGKLMQAINRDFGSFEKFQEQFTEMATTQFGSGWAWLVAEAGALSVMQTSNQDSPLSAGAVPLLLLDVWEHAYYLHYQNRRPDYIKAWWNVVNWSQVGSRYEILLLTK